METLALHFHGPFTLTDGPACLFTECGFADAAGLYLWTFRRERDGVHLVHYIGQAGNVAGRHKDHLVQILGLNYGIYDAAAAVRGENEISYRGLGHLRESAAPLTALAEYPSLMPRVLAYLDALSVFVAPLDGDLSWRRHVEGCIARNLRDRHPDCCALYDDTRTSSRRETGARLEITSDEPIAGLDPLLDI